MIEASNEIGISVEACKKRVQRAKEAQKINLRRFFIIFLSPNCILETYIIKGGYFDG